MNLFQLGSFTLSSGKGSSFKIECDALRTGSWEAIAAELVKRLPDFGDVEGVERGGIPLAEAMFPYITNGPLLIVDDVLTTGSSIERQRDGRPAVGAVVFAREAQLIPSWVVPLFVMTPERIQ